MAPQVTDFKLPPLCRVDEIADGGVLEKHAVIAGEPEDLLLLRAGPRVQCFLNICPHAGRQLNWAPGKFLIERGLLICAAHGASFSIPEGRCVLGPCRGQQLSEVAIRIEEGEVFLVEQGLGPEA